MSDQGLVNPDAVSITEVQELLPGEVSSMVSDDTVRNAKPVDNVEEELDRLFRADNNRYLSNHVLFILAHPLCFLCEY